MTDECIDPIELFKFEAYHEDPEVQMRAVKKLPTLAVALDVDRTRHELISCLEEFLDMMYFQNDDILSGLAEQLGKFSAFIGGPQYAHILFPMLDRLALSEDVITREKAVESLQHIASLMDKEHLEIYFIPLIHKLCTGKWCYSKCSAAGLFVICYPKVSDDEKADLRFLFFRLLGDESPAVRRAAIGKMSEFVKVVEIQQLKNEFIPEFTKLADDEQDSVRLLNVYVAIAIAARLNSQEIEEYILDTIKNISADDSWRVRYQFANEINSIQTAVGPTITRKSIIHLYKNLVHDSEANIREISARKIVHFCEILQKTYVQDQESTDLDPIIKNEIFPLIKQLDQDVVEDVQGGLYSVITSLSSLLGEGNTKEFLLPLITSSLETGSPKVKENIIANLNNIICIVDINCLTDKVRLLIAEMVDTKATYWRIRRNLIVTLSHIANHSKKEYFNEHLKPLYVKLLNDAVYGVRKVAPLILPVLVKNFGVAWAKESIIPTFIEFHEHNYYLFRMMCLFGIDELIKPTLQVIKLTENHMKVQYLRNIENCSDSTNASQILYKISLLNNFLQQRLQDEWIKFVLDCSEDDEYFHDDVKTYAEDTIEEFRKTGNFDILTVSDYEIENQNTTESYLEGVLYFNIVEFLPVIRIMAQDKVVNVCLRAVNSLKKIIKFSNLLFEELSTDNMMKTLQRLSKEDVDYLKTNIETKLQMHLKSDDEVISDERKNISTCESDNNSLDSETIIFSKEELTSIEQIILNNMKDSSSMDTEDAEKQSAKSEQPAKPEEMLNCDIIGASTNDNEYESETNFMK